MNGNFLSLIKGISEKPITMIILKEFFSLAQEQIKGAHSFLVNIVLGVLVKEIGQGNEIKAIEI